MRGFNTHEVFNKLFENQRLLRTNAFIVTAICMGFRTHAGVKTEFEAHCASKCNQFMI